MNKRRKIIFTFLEFLGLKEKKETPNISDGISEKINELKSFRVYLTYIIDHNLLGKQVNPDELSKQLVIVPVRNRK